MFKKYDIHPDFTDEIDLSFWNMPSSISPKEMKAHMNDPRAKLVQLSHGTFAGPCFVFILR